MAQHRSYNVRVVFSSSMQELEYISGATVQGLECKPLGGCIWEIFGVSADELEILFDTCKRCWTF